MGRTEENNLKSCRRVIGEKESGHEETMDHDGDKRANRRKKKI
jgi:hypothetical protein